MSPLLKFWIHFFFFQLYQPHLACAQFADGGKVTENDETELGSREQNQSEMFWGWWLKRYSPRKLVKKKKKKKIRLCNVPQSTKMTASHQQQNLQQVFVQRKKKTSACHLSPPAHGLILQIRLCTSPCCTLFFVFFILLVMYSRGCLRCPSRHSTGWLNGLKAPLSVYLYCLSNCETPHEYVQLPREQANTHLQIWCIKHP